MDIRCERCATEYELDEAKIPDSGFTLKCATCGHVFKVMKGAAPAAGISLRLFRGGEPQSAFCPDNATLQRWIIEQRLLKDDEIAFGGFPWRRLSEVPELSAFFALLSMPPPVLRTQPTPMGTPPVVASPPPPPPPVVAAPPPPPPAPLPVVAEAATVQVTITPEMFAPPPAPAPVVVEAHPPLPSLDEHLTEPTQAPVAAAPPPAPKPAPAPAAKPAPIPVVKAKPPATSKKKPVHADPDIAAIMNRGRTGRMVTIGVFIALGVAATGYFLWPDETAKGPSQQARLAYRRGRDNYLTDSMGSFKLGEDALSNAIKAAGKDGYPEALGALAELRIAWAEQLIARNVQLSADMKALEADGQKDEAEALRKKANTVAAEANDKLSKAISDVNAMQTAGTLTTEAQRAALDYYRLSNNAERANAAVETLKTTTDPETQGHVAEWLAQDVTQRAGAESMLKDVVQKAPEFVRARWWLVDLRMKAGDTAGALNEAREILKAQPSHTLARLFVDAQEKAAAALVASAAPDAGPTTEATATPDKKTPPVADTAKTPEKKEPVADTAKTPEKKEPVAAPPEKKEPVVAQKKEPAPPKDTGAVDVDKLVDQAAAFLDRKKPKKALELYEKIVAVKPRMTDALYGRAVALLRLGKTEEAISAYKKTLDVNPRFGDAMFDLGEAYKKLKDNKNAAKYYQQYVDTFPTGAQAKSAKALLAGLH